MTDDAAAATDAKAANIKRIGRVIDTMPFARHLNLQFEDAGDGWARIRMKYQDENSTAAKALHGGAISSLIDTTGAMAAWTTAEIATPKYFGSTVGINVNYLSGAIGEDIIAEGRLLKLGRRLAVMEVALFSSAEPERRVAQVTGSYALPEKRGQ